MNYPISLANIKDEYIDYKRIIELKHTLDETKTNIDNYPKNWENVKKIIHKYEYVYTSFNSKKNVALKRPISRSYFKLVEILSYFDINISNDVLCLAEAPGGFIQRVREVNKHLTIYGITLIDNDNDNGVPHWNNALLNKKDIKMMYGVKNNGDIYDIDNIISIVKELKDINISLVTGDGGIDYSSDYNSQEENSLHIIYSEILLSSIILRKGGTFICKIFDIFDMRTIKLIYILYLQYDNVFIYKPCISRLTNSEKYIICKQYKGRDKDLINKMIRNINDINIDIIVPNNFIKVIYDINMDYVIHQIENINKAIKLLEKNNVIRKATDEQLDYARKWCNKYDIKTRL